VAGMGNGMTEICKDHVMVLGQKYTIDIKSEKDDPELKSRYGYIFYSARQIVIQNLIEAWTKDPIKYSIAKMREACRHEIIHAFLYESGLHDSSARISDGWATNEEMVDWFAIQSPKIYQAMKEAKCL
jgi:hypothetical protein